MRMLCRLGLMIALIAVPCAPARAASTLTLSTPTADPVEERVVEITASGSLDAARQLFVFARPESAAVCGLTAADEYAKAGVIELTGQYSWQADGDAVAVGAYSRTRPFTPPAAGQYRLCAYVASTASGVPDAASTTTVAARRAVATAALAVGSETPVEEGPVDVTTSGMTENARKLVVFAESGASEANTCASTPSGEHQKSSAKAVIGSLSFGDGGEALGGGQYAQHEPFTPAAAGRYRLCAYVYRDPAAAPYATATHLIHVGYASATAGIAIPTADPVEEGPVDVTVSGTTQRSRNLHVLVEAGASEANTCATTSNAERQKANVTSITGADAIAPESFSQTHAYVPPTAGLHRVCAYVHRSGSDHVYAFSTRLIEVRRAQATLTLAASTDRPLKDQPFTVTATGTTERTRRLWVYVQSGIAPGASCSATAAAERDKKFSTPLTRTYSGDTVTAPRFEESRPFMPTSDGPRLVCAYVQREEAEPAYAVASLLVGSFSTPVAPAPPATAPTPAVSELRLDVARKLTRGRTRRSPGRTTLVVQAPSGTTLVVRTWHGSSPRRTINAAIPASGRHRVTIRWSCSRTGTHRYEVTGRAADGATKKVRGSWTVTRRHCRSLRR